MKGLVKLPNLALIFFIGMNSFLQADNAPSCRFTLMTFLYNETKVNRCAEYLMCLEKNLQHPMISKIHILYDESKDDENNFLLNYLKTRPVVITLINKRPVYGDFFKIANECYPSCKVIVSNADIFFNATLNLLESYDLNNKFIALTRWNVLKDGSLKLRLNAISQDTWIFQTPIKKIKNDVIMLGLNGCDPEILYYAKNSGLDIVNPCLSVQCCHLHISNIRNFDTHKRPYKKELKERIPHSTL